LSSRYVRLALALLLALSLAGGALARVRVAVIDFQPNAKGVDEATARAITDMMITELWKSGLFTVIERARIEAILQEQNLTLYGLADPKTAVNLGRLLGVQALITGAITQFESRTQGGALFIPGTTAVVAGGETRGTVTIDLRAINPETGEIVMVARESGSATQSIGGVAFSGVAYGQAETEGIMAAATYRAVTRLVDKLKGLFIAKGAIEPSHVVKVDGSRIYLDAGVENRNAKPGDLYLVYQEGEKIVGPRGEVLDVEKEYVALLEVVEAKPRYSIAKLVKGYPPYVGHKAEPAVDRDSAMATRFVIPSAPQASAPVAPSPSQPSATGPAQGAPQPSSSREAINRSEGMEVIDSFPIAENLKNQIKLLHRAGYTNYSNRKYDLALLQFAKAYELYTGNFLDAYWAAKAQLKLGKREEAALWIDRALKANPNYEPALKLKEQEKL